MKTLDLKTISLRDANRAIRNVDGNDSATFEVIHPMGEHAIAAGLQHPVDVTIKGHVGYYCAGMNQHATVTVIGNAGVGVAENMMSGRVHVQGDASQAAGATAHGGLLIIDGNASSRCGVSMKGVDIFVKGSVGHNSAFMAQAGTLVICGDADDGLGDSIYEAEIFLRGEAHGLGADCEEKPMDAEGISKLSALLKDAGSDLDPASFRRYGSARQLYNFKTDNIGKY